MFTITELMTAINSLKEKALGSDNIYCKLLMHLPEKSSKHALNFFNQIWNPTYFPGTRREALTVPIPIPNKGHSDSKNFRGTAFASCFGKLLEKP